MPVCDHWPSRPLELDLLPPRLHCERPWPSMASFLASEALNFDFDANPDPAFHSNADLDPDLVSKDEADPRISNPASMSLGVESVFLDAPFVQNV
jgi:hypothetical protein